MATITVEIKVRGGADSIRKESDWFDSEGRILIDDAYFTRSEEDDCFFEFSKFEIKDDESIPEFLPENKGKNHPFHALPMWRKRLNGFYIYILFGIISLFYPVEIDRSIYKALRDQYEGFDD